MELSKDSNETINLMSQIPLFDSLSENELKMILPYIDMVKISGGKFLFREGDPGDYVSFVVDGVLDVLKLKESDEWAVISTLNKGKSIGEMSILDDFPRSASVRARTNSTLLTMSKKNYQFLVNEHPRIGVKIMIGLARLLSLSMRKTSSRLADYMLPLA